MSFGGGIPRVSQISTSPMMGNIMETNHNPVNNGGLFTREECRNLAKLRSIIDAYDGNKDDVCETIEVAKWLVDCYRAMNKDFQPTATDIASYVQIIDRNQSGKVSREQLEEFIVRYFFNPNRAQQP